LERMPPMPPRSANFQLKGGLRTPWVRCAGKALETLLVAFAVLLNQGVATMEDCSQEAP
jgi:hypothetical protein